MAQLTVDDLKKKYKADWVAGDLVAKVEGKHLSLAKKKNGKINLTWDGERLAGMLQPEPKMPAVRRTPRTTPVKKTETPDAKA